MAKLGTMTTRRFARFGLTGAVGLAVCSTTLAPGAWASAPAPKLVAGFDQQVTGVAVSKTGRIFVNFPRWEKDVPMSVAEVMKDGTLKPYPNAEWNAWSNLKPLSLADHFVCVQSVTVDPQGFLWVVDPAAPGNEFVKPGGVKLVKIDLNTNAVVKVIPFDGTVAPQGSYMNDVRVSPDGRTAYLTDSGQIGALIVVDVASGRARRVLSGDPRTQPEPGVVPMVDGHELRRPDHRIPSFAADGIALDPAGQFVYWQALVGRTLYRVPTAALNGKLSPSAVAAKVETLGTTNVADGFWMDEKGYLFITDPGDNAVRMRAPDGTLTMVTQDDRLRWPDSMAEGADGAIYVTASHIQDMAQFHTTGSTQKGQWQLFRIPSPHT
jgi:sugar lactone lactonase YvrE